MTITYFDKTTEVQLGDHIKTRVWGLWKMQGRVVYLPGVSERNREMEFNGLRWVGVRADDGSFLGEPVEPKGDYLLKRVVFVRRDDSPVEVIGPKDRPFREK